MPLFAALRSTIENIASSTINGSGDNSLYPESPRSIIDSGASMAFVRDEEIVRNKIKHVRTLTAVDGSTLHSTKSGKLQITGGSNLIYVSALVVLSVKENLISVGQLTKSHSVLFTNEGVCLLQNSKQSKTQTVLGDATQITFT